MKNPKSAHSFVLLSILAVLPSVATAAESAISKYFDAPKSCFGRVYSQEHLNKHPQQKVDELIINHATAGQEKAWLGGMTPAKPTRVMRIRLHLRGQDQLWEEFAGCELNGEAVTCSMECDAGQFSIKLREDGKLLLSADSELWFTDCDAGEQVLSPEPDDKLFLLSPLPISECLPPAYQ